MGISSVGSLTDGKNVRLNPSEKIQTSIHMPASSSLAVTTDLPQIAINSVQLEQIFSLYHSIFGREYIITNREKISEEDRSSLTQAIFQKIIISYEEIVWESLNHEILLRLQDAGGMNIFLTAIKEGSEECLKKLIQELGYEKLMKSKDASGRNGLHIAAIYGHSHLIIFLLSKAYFSTQDKDFHGLNALHWAIHERRLNAIQTLLPSTSLGDSWIPISYPDLHISTLALAIASGCKDSIALLLKHNDFKQLNLSESIASFGNILHLMIHANQSHLLQHFIGDHETMKALFEAKDFAERTPLQLAAFLGDLTAIHTLVKGGCFINQGALDLLGTPLLLAAKGEKPEAIQLLITLGADPHLTDKNGLTPLQYFKQQKKLSFIGVKCKNLLENIQSTLKIGKTKAVQQGQRVPMNLALDSFSDEKMVYQGIVQALEKKQVMSELSRISGQGMGAIIATLLACGYRSIDLEEKLPSALSNLFFSDEVEKAETFSVFMEKLKINEEKGLKRISSGIEHNSLCDHTQFQQEIDCLISEKIGFENCTFGELAVEVRKRPTQYKHLHLFVFSTQDQKIIRITSEEVKWKDVVISSALTASLAFPKIFSPIMLLGKNEEGDLYEISNSKIYSAAPSRRSIVDAFDDHSYQEDPYFKGRKTNDRTICFAVNEDKEDAFSIKEITSKSLLRYLIYGSLQQDLSIEEMYSQGRAIPIDLSKGDREDQSIMTFSQSIVEEYLSLVSVPSMQQSQISASPSSAIVLTPWKYRLFLEAPQLDIPSNFITKGKYEDLPSLPLSFIERTQELESIVEAFKTHPKVAISGLGGMGKSTLAMKYGHTCKDQYEFTLFIKVSSEAELVEKLLELAKGLKIIEENPGETLKALKAKLHRSANPYLFIVDGLDHEDLFPLLKIYLPETSRCKVLMTTRAGPIAEMEGFHKIELISFKPEESMDYIFKATGCNQEESEKVSVIQIVYQLGYLPLALAHVAGYIKEQNISFKEYHTLLEKYRLELFHENNINIPQGERSILTTWQISIDAIKSKSDGDLAEKLIEISACLGEGLIPFSLLEKWITLFYPEKNKLTLRRALQLLMNYSLLNSQKEKQSEVTCYAIHSLVQQSIKYKLDDNEKNKNLCQIREVLEEKLGELRKENKYERSILIEYGIHASSLLANNGFGNDSYLKNKVVFLDNLSHLYQEIYFFDQALKYAKDCLDIKQSVYGEGSGHVAESYHTVGKILKDLGRLEEALKMHKKALDIKLKIYGEESSYTAESYCIIGRVLKNSGQIEEALKMIEKALGIQQKIYGEESIDIAESYQLNGEIFKDLGRIQEALYVSEKALEIKCKMLGENSIYTAESYHTVGSVLKSLGRLEEALYVSNKALEIKQKILGKDEGSISTSYQNIGKILQDLGKLEEALKMSEKALEIRRKIYGEESGYTSTSYQIVGGVLKDLGRLEEALKMSEKALGIRQKVFGEDSIYTSESYQAVGMILKDLGRFEEALKISEKRLEINRKIYGEDTAYVADSYQTVGMILKDLGRSEEALKISEKRLEIDRKIYEEDSAYVADSYQAIGWILRDLGKLEKALQMSERALEIKRRINEEDSIYTLESCQAVGMILKDLGRFEEALKISEKRLAINRKIYGEDSDYVGDSYQAVGWILRDLGRLEDAFKISEKALGIRQKIHGEDSIYILESCQAIGAILKDLGRFEEALKISEKRLEISRKIYGEDFSYTAESYQVIGEILKNSGKLKEALKMSEKALEIKRKVNGEDSMYTAESYQAVGRILKSLGRLEDALKMSKQALEIKQKALGEDSMYTAASYKIVGEILNDLGRFEEALKMSEKALEINQKVFGEKSHYTAASYEDIKKITYNLRVRKQALQLSNKSTEDRPKSLWGRIFSNISK